MQQERANRTGEDVNEIARQAEEQHKAFTERKQSQAASQEPAQVSLAAFETLMNMWRQIQEQRRLRNLTLRQTDCQLDDVPMIFPVITE
jgi:hypothetical protein